MSVMLNFFIDFFVGTICLYTQSIWGVNIMKEVVVALLSGATIPLAFFPEKLHTFANLLPFQAIYNTPLQILIDQSLTDMNYLIMLGKQCLWVVIMLVVSRSFWFVSRRVITVNGG
jgi:ABC-2 type transport system permease protein